MSKTVLGVIGGNGIYAIHGAEQPEWRKVHSSFGVPSDEMLFCKVADLDIVFLPRHGRGHEHSPSSVNYRANIDALKRAGVTDIVAISEVCALNDALHPGDIVVADQFIDHTHGREDTFFGEGLVAHVDLEHPISAKLSAEIHAAATAAGISSHVSGTYVCIEGPQFPTQAERALYRSQGGIVSGMTAATEARLAREAELPYAVAAVVRPQTKAASAASALITALAGQLTGDRIPEPDIETALDGAVLTHPDRRAPVVVARLDAVAGRVLSPSHS